MPQMHINLPLLAVAGFALCSYSLADEEPSTPGALLNDLDMIGSEYGDDSVPFPHDPVSDWLTDFHTNLAKSRIQYFIEQSYSRSWFGHAAEGFPSGQNWYKLHAHVGLNLVTSERHQGTWIKAEVSGSSALDPRSRETTMDDTLGSLSNTDCDIYRDDFYYMPELLLSQGFDDGRSVLMLGVVNQTNYIDTNSYANTSFGQFTAGPFVNNLVLPLGESNFGFMLQRQMGDQWIIQLGGNMLDCESGQNPFRRTTGKAFNLIGEISWTCEDVMGIGRGTHRLEPFMFHSDGENHAGIGYNAEQDLGKSPFAVFFRAGWSCASSDNPGGAMAQVSGGLIVKKPFSIITGLNEADSNYLGLALAVVKPEAGILESDESDERIKPHNREITFQCVYCCAVTPYFFIEPSYQLTRHPAMRRDRSVASVFSIQGILSF